MGCPDWHTAMHSLWLQRLLWIYCSGHARVSGNERADRLASTADITSGLQLGRAEVLRSLMNFLNTDKPEHHSIDRLKERGVEKGSGRHSTLQGRERSEFNQANIGTVLRATLGRLLRDGAERIRAFPSTTLPSSAETETETEPVITAYLFIQTKNLIRNRYVIPTLKAISLQRPFHTACRWVLVCSKQLCFSSCGSALWLCADDPSVLPPSLRLALSGMLELSAQGLQQCATPEYFATMCHSGILCNNVLYWNTMQQCAILEYYATMCYSGILCSNVLHWNTMR